MELTCHSHVVFGSNSCSPGSGFDKSKKKQSWQPGGMVHKCQLTKVLALFNLRIRR